MAFSKDREEEIIDKAANLLGDEEENISIQKALEKLDDIKKSITTTRKNGQLDLLRNKYNLLIEERYEGYNLSKNNLENEQKLINLRESGKSLRKEIKNLDIYKKYIKKVKLQKEYEDITEYLKKKEELEKKERYIEESIASRNGIIDEVLLNDIKDENSLYFSLLDMKIDEEKKLENSKVLYQNKRNEFEEIIFIENLTNDEKNKFIKAVMEKENLEEKISNYENLINDINLIKKEIEKKQSLIGNAINFKGRREEISSLLEEYEDKLKEIKFKLEHVPNDINIRNTDNKIKKSYKLINIFSILIVMLLISIILLKGNSALSLIVSIILALILGVLMYISFTMKSKIKKVVKLMIVQKV
ncbi:hypothetical protein [Clostridium sartagoforme]|uniref:hypothetical protein n=1 Tax=Clostridium sartagoforme TaxID=84031 RepID=UPI0003A9E95C|nr:hypothetical protein [Clostridium sartagoforme]